MEPLSNTFLVDPHGKFQFGRYPEPFVDANVADGHLQDYPKWLRAPTKWNRWLRSLRLKEWHFLSVNHDEVFLAFAVAQLGYVSNLFLYYCDKKTNEIFELGERYLLGRNLTFGDSSIGGRTLWRGKACQVDILNQHKGWEVSLQAAHQGTDVFGQFFIQRDEAMALVYPLGKNRAAYTHKEAGNRVHGQLRINHRELVFEPATTLGTSDWSRSFLNHTTQWYFSCMGCISAEGHRIGLNLSRLIYDEPPGISRENTVWVNGKSYQIGEVRFTVPGPEAMGHKPWRIEGFELSTGSEVCIDLQFEPIGFRKENVSVGVLSSKFTQAFGYYSGKVTLEKQGYRINRSFGVAEKHFAKW